MKTTHTKYKLHIKLYIISYGVKVKSLKISKLEIKNLLNLRKVAIEWCDIVSHSEKPK